MNFTKDILHQILDPTLSANERARICCKYAKQFEEGGNYEAACDALGEFWRGIGEQPALNNLDEHARGEVLLRIGALTGWIGSTRQIRGAQEAAKDLINQSIAIFAALANSKKVAEAQTEIALCYRREGALDEARVMFAEALSRLDDQDGDIKAVALLRSAILEQLASRLTDAFSILRTAAPLFEASTNHTIKGRFHNEFALVLRRLGTIENRTDYTDRALIEYAAASFHFGEAGHSRYQACVENNLGFLFTLTGKFSEAHEHLDRAQALFTTLGDRVRRAQVDETRARVMIGEGHYAKAEKLVSEVVKLLEQGDENVLLAEALTTQGVVLACRGNYEQASLTFQRAAEVAQATGDVESAGLALVTLIEQLGHRLSNEKLCVTIERADALLEKCRDFATVQRFSHAKSHVLFLTNAHPGPPQWSNFVLEEVLQRHECRFVQLALEDARGSVTKAADLLGLRGHQSVNSILHRRCQHLLNLRTPIKPRRRRLIHADVRPVSIPPQTNQPTRELRILHVEDDETIAAMAKEMLEEQGWQVETCANGSAALKKISSKTDYDLLLVDYKLPDVNGLALVRRARQAVHRSQIPIIVLSATPVEAEAREAGADIFLYKPLDVNSLVETVTRLIAKREQRNKAT